ncbi:hypothetical protein BS50DRAFT_539961 [Corynespora cassiicola Philippines]|uniref:Aminoglycoside phosphotransferase domain-containing protein n=1 Tax=Corynespora cassiicola Philippines TaxID=1448308 RepID=A0A2T2PAA1_CORCC|nr:hypothetical protein BS50DRAFT_539961 [Corynespora cassiicola Philippines]
MSPNLPTTFWARMELDEQYHDLCLKAVNDIFPGHAIKELSGQGYCSFTLEVSQEEGSRTSSEDLADSASDKSSNSPSPSPTCTSSIVQIRPYQHYLDIHVAQAATTVYSPYAPRISTLNMRLPGRLMAFEMERLPGIPYSLSQPRLDSLSPDIQKRQVNLIRSFASFIACSWPNPLRNKHSSRSTRADSPMSDVTDLLSECTGKVGRDITLKLQRLSNELADRRLRARAQETLHALLRIRDYPVSVCHGDLIPTNMLVDPATWAITGVVDWAEAEYLPFGTCLYGLEHLLGYLDTTDRAGEKRWRYYDNAGTLRQFFWTSLIDQVPELRERTRSIMLMRDVGVLLWYGYAWDEGRIDRVVWDGRDDDEMECLRVFLGVPR